MEGGEKMMVKWRVERKEKGKREEKEEEKNHYWIKIHGLLGLRQRPKLFHQIGQQ